MTWAQALAHAGAAALLVGLAACSSKKNDDGGSDNPNGPSGGSNTVYYSAISASDGTGFGSSSPCLPFADCPNGTGYVQRVESGWQSWLKDILPARATLHAFARIKLSFPRMALPASTASSP